MSAAWSGIRREIKLQAEGMIRLFQSSAFELEKVYTKAVFVKEP